MKGLDVKGLMGQPIEDGVRVSYELRSAHYTDGVMNELVMLDHTIGELLDVLAGIDEYDEYTETDEVRVANWIKVFG
jgi:hypothetical protein